VAGLQERRLVDDEQPKERVFGLDMEGLPEGCVAVDAIIVLKTINADGGGSLFVRQTPNLQPWDAVGMIDAVRDIKKASVFEGWGTTSEKEEEGDDGSD
jgi:hypothetical protein